MKTSIAVAVVMIGYFVILMVGVDIGQAIR
jgi:hypothetical protein